ncbi:restriction endonuclease subunit S [Rhizobium ruizarguesonis]
MGGWTRKRLDQVATLQRGFDLPASQRTPGQFPLVTSSGATDTHNEAKVKGPGVVTGRSGSIGNVFHIEQDFWPLNTALYVKDFHGNDPRFVFHLLHFIDLGRFASGAGVPTLNRNDVHGETVRVPDSLEEQQRIVVVLDEAFEGLDRARANAEANLKSARELFETSLIAVFDEVALDAPRLALAKASSYFGRGRSRHRPRNDPSLYSGTYPFVQTGDIRNSDGTVVEFTQTYNENGLAQSKLWPAGTICITIAANIAETAVLGFEACFPDSIIGMVVDPKVAIPEYVEYMLRYFAAELKALGKGSAQDNINLATFERATFPFPLLEEQREVVEKLSRLASETASLVDGYLNKLRDIDDLRQSLLQKAFAGELTRTTESAYAA